MMTRKRQRLWFVGCLLTFAAGVVIFLLTTINDHLLFFVTPSELKETPSTVRLGGLVVEGSIIKTESDITFTVTDGDAEVRVHHVGIVPDLFRDKQGVVAEGRLVGTTFQSTTLLAKHDENYMPREVADALKARGEWRP